MAESADHIAKEMTLESAIEPRYVFRYYKTLFEI
jgi:hypothetical protein